MQNLKTIMLNMRYINTNEVFKSLKEIRYAIVKGEALSMLAYGKTAMRHAGDIDILISRNNLEELYHVLKINNFNTLQQNRLDYITMLAYSHQTFPWIKKSQNYGDVIIDVNYDIFWGEYTGKRIDIFEFLSDAIEMEIYGCKIKTLPLVKALVQLILHHYKEMNSIYHLAGHNCINYNMFKDLYYLWKNNQDSISLEKLYDISFEYEIIHFVFYMLHFTNQIFHDSELEKYVEAFKTTEGLNLLDYYGLAEKERKPWKVDFETRLETENLYDLIKYDLTDNDIEKLERNRRIFG